MPYAACGAVPAVKDQRINQWREASGVSFQLALNRDRKLEAHAAY
jgi:hypothetical protein